MKFIQTEMSTYEIILYTMVIAAVVVFIALFYFKAGYGYLGGGNWGPQISNKTAWVLMETPALAVMVWMLVRYILQGDSRGGNVAVYAISGLYILHYFQRSFIFPLLMRGKGRMPVSIMSMGIVFNCINAWLIGQWLFVECPEGAYGADWFKSGYFIFGTILFFVGMFINIQSDYIIRHLRKEGDTGHYIPDKGLYKYVTSANYFGELVEWTGYAILSMSPAAFVFVIWTFANLAPRSKALTEKYIEEFGEEYESLGRKNLIPFIW